MKKDVTPAQTIVRDVCRIQKGERVLVIANPETSAIAQELYEASSASGAQPSLVFQPAKKAMDNANPEVLAAIASNPDVCFSVSEIKLGKDPSGAAHPYMDDAGVSYNHIFDYLLYGKKTMRSVWTPGITRSMYERTVQIDYAELSRRCIMLAGLYAHAESVHVTSPAGTDVIVPVSGRRALCDDGDFSRPGTGGNIPSGEVFISPVVGSGNCEEDADGPEGLIGRIRQKVGKQQPAASGTNGRIVFDGSMTFGDGDALLETPVAADVESGFVTRITGGEEARRLSRTIADAEQKPLVMERSGMLPEGMGRIYRRNARNIGELGIGLNPAADITGNMLEDEKAFRTCHFAIGENYDSDAPALIHLDGVVRNPTIVITYEDGSKKTVMRDGGLLYEE